MSDLRVYHILVTQVSSCWTAHHTHGVSAAGSCEATQMNMGNNYAEMKFAPFKPAIEQAHFQNHKKKLALCAKSLVPPSPTEQQHPLQ